MTIFSHLFSSFTKSRAEIFLTAACRLQPALQPWTLCVQVGFTTIIAVHKGKNILGIFLCDIDAVFLPCHSRR